MALVTVITSSPIASVVIQFDQLIRSIRLQLPHAYLGLWPTDGVLFHRHQSRMGMSRIDALTRTRKKERKKERNTTINIFSKEEPPSLPHPTPFQFQFSFRFIRFIRLIRSEKCCMCGGFDVERFRGDVATSHCSRDPWRLHFFCNGVAFHISRIYYHVIHFVFVSSPALPIHF